MSIERRPCSGPEGRASAAEFKAIVQGAKLQLTIDKGRYVQRFRALETLPSGRREVESRALNVERDRIDEQNSILEKLAAQAGITK